MASPFSLEGRVAIVTGASSGIGAAIVHEFARAGALVVAAARREEQGQAVVAAVRAEGRQADFVRTDVTVPADVERLVAEAEGRHGHVDVLVSNAGIMASGSAPDTSLELWRAVIDTNLAGPFYLAKYGIPALRRAGGGSMVAVASELGLVGARETVAYCAAKGGLINMVRAISLDGAAEGIRVNALCPGPIDTPMLRTWLDAAEDPESLERTQLAPIPLARWGRPEEIARAALFLASDGASYMSGSVMVADGGATSWYGL
ncbi:MAG: meso-butanediol dehydrogenase / (S,S)-butanediol dehydrogenase / diacetyl reductase [Chloroflexota bacterium]|jgi:NAD(P)-dependent dehydrogenase (short-subunit alcohol dehydrogenase family)|nr:meso-butanediol dehydrogenase / (S,S)-butanediol dehydrogenase / diacetyl reductase [Chloroflexota bacterium]